MVITLDVLCWLISRITPTSWW